MFCARNLARLTAVCLFALPLASLAQAPQIPPLRPKTPSAPIPLPPPNPSITPSLTQQDVTAFLDGFLPLQLQRDDVAGATVSITQNGQPLILKGYGYADYKKKTPVDPVTTTFRPGSISKLFTYVAMMQLVEQGKLSLDTNIQQYLDFPIKPGPSGIGDAPITLRNLATHTAGFEEEIHDFGSDKSGKLPITIRDFVVRNQPRRFAAPSKALAYSNYGITLIGYIVQRVSIEPFADYIQRHIFTPLGMTHSTFKQPLPPGFTATLGYLSTSKPNTGFEGVSEVPAGGLSSTAADMAIFGQMLLNHGSFNGQKILDPSSVATLFTPQFTPAPGVNPWDLGFYEENRNGLRFIGHGGDLLACHSQFWIEPTHGLTFFISYNSAGAQGVAREAIFRALVDRYLPGPANHPAYIKLSAKDLAAYTGFYQTSRRADSNKTRLLTTLSPRKVEASKDGDLTVSTVKDFHGALVHLRPIGNDSFYDEDGQFTLHFERDTAGVVTGYVTPSHSDRVPFVERPAVLFSLIAFALVTILVVCIAPVIRLFRRVFLHNRPQFAPQPGTILLTRQLQLAALACVVVVAYLGVLLAHTSEVTNFYQIGFLDRYFAVQNILTATALFGILVGVISGILDLTLPIRPITKLKFALVIVALLCCFWFFLYFHFLGSAIHY